MRRASVVFAAILLFVMGTVIGVRFAVLAPGVRHFIETHVDGLKAGRVGRLQVSGLKGDLWRDFTLDRLAIADERGVWIEARGLRLAWRPSALLTRTIAADVLTAKSLRVLRRPVLGPKTGEGGMPVSIDINDLRTRVELLPEFSYRRGLYDVAGALEIRRGDGGERGKVSIKSLLHDGDHLDARFDIGGKRPLLVSVDAEEAEGGALAGALGLPADDAFELKIDANGKTSAGRFTALATTGSSTPLQAKGAWSDQGGQADGRVSLTASSLTRGLAERFGDEVVFNLYGRKTPGELYALDGRLTSANLVVTARGQGDIGERRTGPAGLAVSLTAGDLSKLVGAEGLGAAKIEGVLRGDGRDMRFTGQADVADIALGGYRLGRASGPLEIDHRDKTVDLIVKLDGADGGGEGYLAALLGASPRAELQARRLENGRLLLRELTATGSGLKVDASGGRTLLGGLTFKGTAQFSNLESARPGAAGVLSADWSAVQDRKGRPWAFGFDAKGAGLALGVSELDRLLGGEPTLKARAQLAGRELTVSEAKLAGAALSAQTSGVLAETGELDFKLDWNATGPFRAGPVEVSGKAGGTGALGGDLAAPKVDLAADFDEIDVPRLPLKAAHLTVTFLRAPDGSSGQAALTASSDFGPASARTNFGFPQGGLDLTDLAVDAGGLKASGSASLRRSAPSAADLDVAVNQGAFLDAGRIVGKVKIVDAAGGARANLSLAAQNAILPGRQVAIADGRLAAEGPVSQLPYTLAANGASRNGRWRLNGQGVFAHEDEATDLSFSGSGRLGRRELKTVEPAHLVLAADGGKSVRLRLEGSSAGRLDVDAKLTDGQTDVQMTAAGLDLGLVNPDLAGKVNANLDLKGRGSSLRGALDARLAGARGLGADPATGLDGALNAQLDETSLTIKATGSNAQGLTAAADITLPAESSASPFRIALNRTKPIKGDFSADGEVRPLWDLLVGGERTLSGHVKTSGSISGTLADPRAVGQASVDGGRFTDAATGLVLRDVQLKADLADNAVSVSEATGADAKGGSVTGGGRISLLRNGASTFKLDLHGFRIIDNETASASATGPVTIDRGADGKMKIAGKLQVDQADIAADPPTPSGVVAMEVVERNKPVDLDSTLAAPERSGPGIALDVDLKASRRVFLRGRGLDLELSLDAHVGGATSRPILNGEARVVRGDYEFAGKRFEFDPRGVVYLATSPQAIRLDLTATRSDTSLVAVVRIRGTAAKPEITLTSTPVLPSDEVLAQVLFGTSASQLSPLEAAQLASALSALAGGGGFDVIGGLRNFAGLDRLALGGGGESAVSVSGGKYLTDDVYLEITGGGRDGASAQVEWRVRDNLSVISKVGGQGDAKLSVRWRKDY